MGGMSKALRPMRPRGAPCGGLHPTTYSCMLVHEYAVTGEGSWRTIATKNVWMTVLWLTHLQRPALAVQISYPCVRHPAREVGEDMDNRGPIAGSVFQRDPYPPKDVRVAVFIHDFDPLLRHTAGFRAATLAERFHNLEREPPMFAGDEERLPLVNVTQKVSRTKIAVFNPEIARLHRL